MSETITLKKGFDAHCHFRQDDMLSITVPATASQFSWAVAMGNTLPAVKTAHDAHLYLWRINSAVSTKTNFTPLPSIMLTKETTPEMVDEAGKNWVPVLKYIPEGVSTNSRESVKLEDLPKYYPCIEAAHLRGMMVCVHWESLRDANGRQLHDLEREEAAIPFLYELMKTFPNLRMVVEHASTRAMIEYVKQQPLNVRATLTLHHALVSYSEVFDLDGLIRNPFLYCKPIVKHARDRDAVASAMVSGDEHFFYGSDSAPHPVEAKIKAQPAAGIFTPFAKLILAQFFEDNNALKKLDQFDAGFAFDHYGMARDWHKMDLVREEWVVPNEYHGIVPFMAGRTLRFKIAT